jgi:gamma-glutamylcyclotransferase (GGCT)/AIG2-like uncharacterized protein YtfP
MPDYRMYLLEDYPALVRVEVGKAIIGELYEMPEGCALDELDDFEGVPDLFDRQPIDLAGLKPGLAQAYFYARPIPPFTPSATSYAITESR